MKIKHGGEAVNQNMQKRALNPPEVSAVYGVPAGTLANMRHEKRGPKFYKIGSKKIIYFAEDIEAWLRSNPVETIDSVKG